MKEKLDHKLAVLWAADCAEHVLPFFEKDYPEDDRPRKAIETGRAWARGEITTGKARAAALDAHAAARDANHSVARAAARAAGHAAGTAHVLGHAPHAANYAITAADEDEIEWQYKRLPECLQPIIKKMGKKFSLNIIVL